MKGKNYLQFIIAGLVAILIYSCTTEIQKNESALDPLPSWNDGETKTSIVNFVHEISEKQSEYFVPVPDRIAVFDNDGNLWSEKPMYFQLIFVIDRVREMAPRHPEWQTEQPFKALV